MRRFGTRINHAVHFVGVNERRGPGTDDGCPSLDGYPDFTRHHQKQFVVRVPVRRMRRVARDKHRLVHFNVISGMGYAVENRPRLAQSKFLYRQLAVGLDKGAE